MALTHSTFEELFDAIADAIREQEGSSAEIIADTFPTRIRSLAPTGTGLDTTDATAVAADIMSGKTAYVNGVKVEGTFTVDAEITAQEEKIAEQDAIIANLMTALEGKAVSGGSHGKTTKTINIDWSGDREGLCQVSYISNNEIVFLNHANELPTIEAEGGIVLFYDSSGGMSYYSDNFIKLYQSNGNTDIDYVLIAKQDGETLYAVSSDRI